MKRIRTALCLILAAALLAGTLSGCSGTNPIDWVKQKFRDVTGVSEEATADPTETASADNAAPDREIPVALDTEISNELVRYGLAYQAEYGLDPYNCLSLNNRVIFSFLYEPLFAVNSAYEAVPVLAEGYDISDDGLTTTVYLQKDVRFHDGSRLTAKDVLYSIDQARGSDYYGSRFYAVTNASADGDYTVTQEVKLRGIVVSSVQDNNYFDNRLALQSDLKPRCGITLRTDETLYRNPGEELEIDLKGAVVGVNAETGVMELKPVSDDRVVRSETTQVTPEALPVTYAQLASGDYESMYVSLDVQVVVSDLSKVLSDNVTVQTADDERFTLYARQNSTFGIDAVRHCGRVRREQRRDALHGGGFRGDERAPLRRRHHASLRVVGHDPHGGQRRRQVHLLFRFERHGVDRRRFGDGDGRHGRQHHGQAEFLGQ